MTARLVVSSLSGAVLSISASIPATYDAGGYAAISAGMESLLGTVNFVDGQRYDQFDSGMDKAAAYGVGALVAGKVAMKIGFFAGFLKILFVAKKFLILGAIAVGAAVKKFAGRKNESTG